MKLQLTGRSERPGSSALSADRPLCFRVDLGFFISMTPISYQPVLGVWPVFWVMLSVRGVGSVQFAEHLLNKLIFFSVFHRQRTTAGRTKSDLVFGLSWHRYMPGRKGAGPGELPLHMGAAQSVM